MKKVLALVLVLSMAGIAGAGYQIAAPDKVNVNTDATFQIIISGAAEGAANGGVYGDIMPLGVMGVVVTPNAGNLGSYNVYPEFGGADFVAGGIKLADGSGLAKAGNWVIFTYASGQKGSFASFNFFDYDVSFDQPVATQRVEFVPEPMTLSLLGLGALVLRRRS